MTDWHMEYCPPDDWYCPCCGTKLIDEEVREITEPPRMRGGQVLSCAACGVISTIDTHSTLSADERMRLWKLRNPQYRKVEP